MSKRIRTHAISLQNSLKIYPKIHQNLSKIDKKLAQERSRTQKSSPRGSKSAQSEPKSLPRRLKSAHKRSQDALRAPISANMGFLGGPGARKPDLASKRKAQRKYCLSVLYHLSVLYRFSVSYRFSVLYRGLQASYFELPRTTRELP